MGELAHVRKALRDRNKRSIEDIVHGRSDEILDYLAAVGDSFSEQVNQMGLAVRLEQTMERLAGVVSGLEGRLDRMEERLNGAVGAIEIPDNMPAFVDIATRLEAVEQALAGEVARAVSSIKFPEMPEIPEPKEVDLSGLERQLLALALRVDGIEIPEFPEIPEPPKREFEFIPEYKPGGAIKRVVCKEI